RLLGLRPLVLVLRGRGVLSRNRRRELCGRRSIRQPLVQRRPARHGAGYLRRRKYWHRSGGTLDVAARRALWEPARPVLVLSDPGGDCGLVVLAVRARCARNGSASAARRELCYDRS